MPTLRVLSVDARAAGRSRDALARSVADADPDGVADVLCLHNAPHLGRWRQRVAAFARAAGRVVVVPGGRSAGSNALFSTLAVDVDGVADARFTGGTALHPPGAALAVLRKAGSEFVVAGATLVGNAAERIAQTEELHAAIARLTPGHPPAIVSAIGIDRPGTAAWQSLAAGRHPVGGRFFVDERIRVVDAERTVSAGPLPAVLAEVVLDATADR